MSCEKDVLSVIRGFHSGVGYDAADIMGVHADDDRVTVRVWAPNADNVSLCGDHNGWCTESCPMEKEDRDGIWRVSLEKHRFPKGTKYKFAIRKNGAMFLKSDPFAFGSETREKTASVYTDISGFEWTDRNWMEFRRRSFLNDGEPRYSVPINVYELHLASWMTRDGRNNKNGDAYLNYREIADRLAPYARRMGYTHVELMPITEYPCDSSWGYQACSFFAPSSRFGSPEDLMYFVNTMHSCGIGVILDWTPAHFASDPHGLSMFDGSPLYECADGRQGSTVWGTKSFDLSKEQVRCFLISSALFWLGRYHFDGLRVDSVASMLYADGAGHGSEVCGDAVSFLQCLNSAVSDRYPDALMIAEDSSAYPGVTRPVDQGGLGFGMKWNMGWSRDTQEYMRVDPVFRKYSHGKLTFSMVYAYSERFVLPISHDDVSGINGSVVGKQFGEAEDKLRGARAFLMYMMSHPGKKLFFMGNELGQLNGWDHEMPPDWNLENSDMHRAFRDFVAALNDFYLRNDTLWYDDFSWDGFRWVKVDESELNLLAFERRNGNGGRLLCVFNFSGSEIKDYALSLPNDAADTVCGEWETVFSTEGGSSGHSYADGGRLSVSMPPLSAIYLAPRKPFKIR